MKIITTGRIFILNCELSRFLNDQVNLYDFFFSLERKFKLKFEMLRNFE
jgi:hypothetical protein